MKKKTKKKLILLKIRSRASWLAFSRKEGMTVSTIKKKTKRDISLPLKIADKRKQIAENLLKKVRFAVMADFKQMNRNRRSIKKGIRTKIRRRYKSTRG